MLVKGATGWRTVDTSTTNFNARNECAQLKWSVLKRSEVSNNMQLICNNPAASRADPSIICYNTHTHIAHASPLVDMNVKGYLNELSTQPSGASVVNEIWMPSLGYKEIFSIRSEQSPCHDPCGRCQCVELSILQLALILVAFDYHLQNIIQYSYRLMAIESMMFMS